MRWPCQRAVSLAVLLRFWLQSQGGCAEECFCKYPADANLTGISLPPPWEPAPEELEPLWTCVRGFRQYSCLRKIRHGHFSVKRGMASDRRAPLSYCGSARARDACQAPPQAGYSIAGGVLGAVGDLNLQVTCPWTVNCLNASAFLLDGESCAIGPFPNASSQETMWMVGEPTTVIQSPTFLDGWHGELREPFAFVIDMDGDTILEVTMWSKRVRTFERLRDGTGNWGEQPSALYKYPDEEMWLNPMRYFNTRPVAMSQEAILTQFQFNDAWDAGYSFIDQDAWNAKGQKVVLLPRGDAWGSEPPVELHGLVDKAGFGISGDTSGGYTIVGSLHSDREATTAGTAQIFERPPDSNWTTSPEVVLEAPADETFGHMVAIDAGSPPPSEGQAPGPATALVAAPAAGTVYVFERGPTGWSTTASALLERDAGGAAFPAEYGYPSSLAISGAYAIVGGSEMAFIYSRRDGLWTDPPVILSGYTGPGALFASSCAIADLGGGSAVAVVGARGEDRALFFERNPDSGTWAHRELTVDGRPHTENPQGFGRAVGAGPHAVAVTSDEKKVFVYTQQLVGTVDRTRAAPFTGHGPDHVVGPFDARHLRVGVQHKLCVNLAASEDGDRPEEAFKDVGLKVLLTWAPRPLSTQEL